jgi:hypothetical protein
MLSHLARESMLFLAECCLNRSAARCVNRKKWEFHRVGARPHIAAGVTSDRYRDRINVEHSCRDDHGPCHDRRKGQMVRFVRSPEVESRTRLRPANISRQRVGRSYIVLQDRIAQFDRQRVVQIAVAKPEEREFICDLELPCDLRPSPSDRQELAGHPIDTGTDG